MLPRPFPNWCQISGMQLNVLLHHSHGNSAVSKSSTHDILFWTAWSSSLNFNGNQNSYIFLAISGEYCFLSHPAASKTHPTTLGIWGRMLFWTAARWPRCSSHLYFFPPAEISLPILKSTLADRNPSPPICRNSWNSPLVYPILVPFLFLEKYDIEFTLLLIGFNIFHGFQDLPRRAYHDIAR